MYVRPIEAIKYYRVSENTLRTWSKQGKIKFTTTDGGHRRYLIDDETDERKNENERLSIIYARVSSRKQSADLERQIEYLREKYPKHTPITDIGSGINFNRSGFRRILDGLFRGTIKEVVVAKRDRFSRFGYSLFEWIFEKHNSLLVCNTENDEDIPDELTEDLMSIVAVFTARYYGKRKYKRNSNL